MCKRLIRLIILTAIIVGPIYSQAQPAPEIQPLGLIGSPAGNGQWPAVAQSRADLRTHTLYRPLNMPDESLPVLLWGNGGCSDNGLGHSYFLREIASHGYLVIALGSSQKERPLDEDRPQVTVPARPAANVAAGPPPGPDATTVEQHFYSLEWLAARNADPVDELFSHADMSRIAVAGHSCGGLQAIKAAADPRIDTALIFNSGIYVSDGRSGINVSKEELNNLHGPVVYITGGPSDIAHLNSVDDVSRIDHVPVFFGWLPVGHGGTFTKAADGAEWGEIAVNWLAWQFQGDESAGLWFVGDDCDLCGKPEWTVERFISR